MLLQVAQRLIDGVVGEDTGIERHSAIGEQRGAVQLRGRIGYGALLLFQLRLVLRAGGKGLRLRDDSLKVLENEDAGQASTLLGIRIHALRGEHAAQKRQPLIGAGIVQRRHYVVHARAQQAALGGFGEGLHADARLIGEGGAVQQQVDHGIQIALIQARANRGVLPGEPTHSIWPHSAFLSSGEGGRAGR